VIRRFVIFGATGDLTARYLLPAIVTLRESGRVPEDLAILGVSHDDWDTTTFRRHVEEGLGRHASEAGYESRQAIVSRLEYKRADVTDARQVAEALGRLEEPVVAYLALPPRFFAPAIEALAEIGLPEGSRVVVEKPFGQNLESAQKLNALLHKAFPEEAVFRTDHFLGIQTVRNIIGLRFGNRIFEPLWSRAHVERVEIVWDETLALEGRASYYDSAGALQDMVQNHLLQLLCLVGMEAPLTLSERDLRDRKVDLLRAVRRLSPEEVERQTVRARYGAGRIGDQEVPAYADEDGIDPSRETETFAQVTLAIDNWRWAGVPFVLRTGKALAESRRQISIHFQPVPHLAFGQPEDPRPNVLCLRLDPDCVRLLLNVNRRSDPVQLYEMELEAELAPQELSAYGHLLLDILDGDPTLSIRADEAEESWRIVEPILQTWKEGRVPLLEYPAGSAGPETAQFR
jgi:glucose-6-phosphate 1-dehydrogenase